MDWAKVKNTLIYFLLLINLIMGTILYLRVNEGRKIEQQFTSDAQIALERMGVSVSEEVLRGPSDQIYTLEIERDFSLERATFEALIGESTVEDQGSGIYYLIGGYGEARISSAGNFDIQLSVALPVTSDTPPGLAAEVLETMGISDMGDSYEFGTGGDMTDRAYTVVGTQIVRGFSVFNRNYTFYFDEAGLRRVSGGRLLGSPLVSDVTLPRSAVTALFTFVELMEEAGTPCREISSILTGYVAELSAPGYTKLMPVYELESDVGTYYMDALTLELYRQLP